MSRQNSSPASAPDDRAWELRPEDRIRVPPGAPDADFVAAWFADLDRNPLYRLALLRRRRRGTSPRVLAAYQWIAIAVVLILFLGGHTAAVSIAGLVIWTLLMAHGHRTGMSPTERMPRLSDDLRRELSLTPLGAREHLQATWALAVRPDWLAERRFCMWYLILVAVASDGLPGLGPWGGFIRYGAVLIAVATMVLLWRNPLGALMASVEKIVTPCKHEEKSRTRGRAPHLRLLDDLSARSESSELARFIIIGPYMLTFMAGLGALAAGLSALPGLPPFGWYIYPCFELPTGFICAALLGIVFGVVIRALVTARREEMIETGIRDMSKLLDFWHHPETDSFAGGGSDV